MTFTEVGQCLSHITAWELHAGSKEQHRAMVKALQDWLVEGAPQDLSWVRGPTGKVIKKYGR